MILLCRHWCRRRWRRRLLRSIRCGGRSTVPRPEPERNLRMTLPAAVPGETAGHAPVREGSVISPTWADQPRELRSVRPRTMPMKSWTRGSSLSTDQASPTLVGGRSVTGRYAVSLRSCDRHRHDDHPGTAGDHLDRVADRHRRPVQLRRRRRPARLVREDELLVVEVGQADLLDHGRDVILRHHGDRNLVVQRDAVQPVTVDRQPDQAHAQAAVAQPRLLRLLLDRDQLERVPRPPAPPGARPLVGGRSRHEADAERGWGSGHASRLAGRAVWPGAGDLWPVPRIAPRGWTGP